MQKLKLFERCYELLPLKAPSNNIYINENDSSIESDSDQSKQNLKCQRYNQILKLSICVYLIEWVCVICVVIPIGSPSRQLLPINYKGETCGEDDQSGKPNLLYLDITLCAGLNAAESGCSSHTVCVEKCPNTFWASTQGNSSGLEQFCDNLSGRPYANLSQLVEDELCPAYLLPSRSVMGRCLPRLEDIEIPKAKLNEMKTYDGGILNSTNLKEGIVYLTDSFNSLGYDQQLHIYMRFYWWIVPFQLVISSLIWTVVAFTCHHGSRTSRDYMKQTQVPAEKFNIAVKLISEAKEKVKKNKTTLLFPILPFFAQVIVLFWPLAVSTNLSSIGLPQFRVVNACSTETCINMNSEKTFQQDDLCDPDIFSKCTGCPRAQCVFHKFQHKTSRYIVHGYNFVAAIVLLFCAHKIVYTLVTGSRDLLIKKMKAEVLSLLACIICGFGKTKLQEVEKTTLEEQEEILIGTSSEGEHQGNQVQRKRESPSRQQRRVRHAAAHNANPEKVAITETEQDSVQRVNKNNEVQRKGEGPSWQQQPLRQSAAYNANAEKNAITETEQDSVQRVKEKNEDSLCVSSP